MTHLSARSSLTHLINIFLSSCCFRMIFLSAIFFSSSAIFCFSSVSFFFMSTTLATGRKRRDGLVLQGGFRGIFVGIAGQKCCRSFHDWKTFVFLTRRADSSCCYENESTFLYFFFTVDFFAADFFAIFVFFYYKYPISPLFPQMLLNAFQQPACKIRLRVSHLVIGYHRI
jgi:hypothetical protein